MRTLLYVLAVLLILGWIIGAFVYIIGGIIHILLVAAIILLVFSYFKRRTRNTRSERRP